MLAYHLIYVLILTNKPNKPIATKYKNGQFESKYEGTYKNGIRDGKGKFTHADGSVKTGHFVDGQLMGQGKMTTEDGHTYDGYFISLPSHFRQKGIVGIKLNVPRVFVFSQYRN